MSEVIRIPFATWSIVQYNEIAKALYRFCDQPVDGNPSLLDPGMELISGLNEPLELYGNE